MAIITDNRPRFQKCKHRNMPGPYRFQVVLFRILVDNILLIEGLDIHFYYKIRDIVYFQNLWINEANRLILIGNLKIFEKSILYEEALK